MTLLSQLSFKFKKGDLDSDTRPLQLLDTIHRAALMPVLRGKPAAGQSHFKDPAGKAGYYGFGADGQYYEGGVQQRTWSPQQSIDDFTDKVTDPVRWQPIGTDLSEGGIDATNDPPFGKRCHAYYVGPGIEVYDRQGLMVFTPGGGNTTGILSGRVSTRLVGSPVGSPLPDYGIWLGIQVLGSPTDYVFVGYVNTTGHPARIVHGEVIAGVVTIHAFVPVPPTTQEAEVAINYDSVGLTSTAYVSFSPIAEDYTGPSWSPIGPPVALGPAWAGVPPAVPRIHATFPAGASPDDPHNISDVRVEVGGGTWEGEEQASWFLETLDGTNPDELAGLGDVCPDELLVCWERDGTGACHITLVDTDDPADPKMWRRWKNYGIWKDWQRGAQPLWSPGWLDADEGLIAITRNTRGHLTGAAPGDEQGEIWVLSLRWDRTIVFTVDGLGGYIALFDQTTGRVLRDVGSWGSRRWFNHETFQPQHPYDGRYSPTSVFVGTLNNRISEDAAPALTYDVKVGRGDDGELYLGYGIQAIPASWPGPGNYYAGVIRMEQGNTPAAFPRWMLRKNDSGFNIWDESDEAWVVVGLSYARAIWWLQAREDGAFGQIEGVLCRKDFTGLAADNLITAPYTEDTAWNATDQFGGMGFNLHLMDSSPVGDDVVLVTSGFFANSHLTALWYNKTTPAISVIKTFAPPRSLEQVGHNLRTIPTAQEYPRWFHYLLAETEDARKLCRIAGSGAQGADSQLTVLGGFWLAYGQWTGLVEQGSNHTILRGAVIDRDDFTLTVQGRIVPPFKAGYGFSAFSNMQASQRFSYEIGVIGEKRTGAVIRILFTGATSIQIAGAIIFLDGSGLQSTVNVVTAPTQLLQLGGDLRFRITRTANTITLYYFDPGLSTWVQLAQKIASRIPLVPYMAVTLEDVVGGLACGMGIEVEKLELTGTAQHFSRPVDFATLPSQMAGVGGGAVFREAIPTDLAGSLVASDTWLFPGLMPRP